MSKFLVCLLLSAISILAFVFAGASRDWFTVPSAVWSIVLSLTLLTGVIYYYLGRVPSNIFTQVYIASIGLKLLGYGTFIGLIIFQDKAGSMENVLLFMASYLIFTALEVGFLFRRING